MSHIFSFFSRSARRRGHAPKGVVLQARGRPQARGASRAFTLIELTIVVVIMGLLAAMGINSFRHHLNSAKNGEVLGMIRSIGVAQEHHLAEHGVYFDVSGGDLTNYHPAAAAAVGTTKRTFFQLPNPGSLADRWRYLAPEAPTLVQYSYASVAGLPGAAAPVFATTGVTWPPIGTIRKPWYAIQAVGDVTGGGAVNLVISSSLNPTVYQENRGE